MENQKQVKKKGLSKKKIIIAVAMIAFAFFGSFAIYFILQITLNTQNPVVVVISRSMTPTINEGDILFVHGVDPADIKNGTAENKDGDIIVFDAYGIPGWTSAPVEPVVHRVIDKYQLAGIWYFETKGDANPLPDPAPVSEDRVFGVVCGRIPYLGWIKIILADSGLLIPLLVIISILLVISIIWDLFKEDKEKKSHDGEVQENMSNQDPK
jgi:signal peptidase I